MANRGLSGAWKRSGIFFLALLIAVGLGWWANSFFIDRSLNVNGSAFVPNRLEREPPLWVLSEVASEAALEALDGWDSPDQAETTVNSGPSAWDDEEILTIRAGAIAAATDGNSTDERPDELLELLTHEARLMTARLVRENAELKEEAELRDRRIRKLSESLAEAQAALDIREERRALQAGASPEAVPDAPPEARILNVNSELGMVILDQGAQQGVRYGLTMSVLREQRVVARVRVVDVRAKVAGAVVEETSRSDYPKAGDRAALVRLIGS